jgi:hypothetical protein
MIPRRLFDPEVDADDSACRNVRKFSHSDTEGTSLQGDLFYVIAHILLPLSALDLNCIWLPIC